MSLHLAVRAAAVGGLSALAAATLVAPSSAQGLTASTGSPDGPRTSMLRELGPTRSVAAPPGAGWHRYQSVAPVRASVAILKGRVDAHGRCSMQLSGTVAPGGAAVQTDELAFNAATCSSQVATYPLTPAQLAALEAESARQGSASKAGVAVPATTVTSGASRTSAPTLALASRGAYSRTWYEDPPGLDVTSVRNDTSWTYNGSCVTGATGSYAYTWLRASGWGKLSDSWRNQYSCDRSESSSFARFRNGVFCATIDTYNTYDRNNIYGQENGGYTWSYNATKSGGCTALLSIRHTSAFT